MPSALATYWNALRSGEPGRRFTDVHRMREEARREGRGGSRTLLIGLGILLILVGMAIGWLPGPGGVLALVGGALLAAESRRMAGALDWTEVRVRGVLARAWALWRERGPVGRALLSVLALALFAGAAVVVYRSIT